MTRLAVLADIHGNLPALEAVITDLTRFDVDHVVVAGDAVHRGPFSAQVVERIAQEGWAVVRGNNEMYLLDYQTPRAPAEWDNYDILTWLVDSLQDWHHVIACWPDTLQLRFPDAPPIRVFHGLPDNPNGMIFPHTSDDDVKKMLKGVEETTIITAHTHISMDRQVGRWHILNPGTVGLPIDANPDASYMILDGTSSGWKVTGRRISYDVNLVLAEFKRQKVAEMYELTGNIIIEEFKTARMVFSTFFEWCRRERPGEKPTKALLDEFLIVDSSLYLPSWNEMILRPLYTNN